MQEVVRQFIGNKVKPSNRCRGLYIIFPKLNPKDSVFELSPHTDGTAGQLNCMIYAAECPPGGGGFTLWPGSHKSCYYHMETEYNMEPKQGYSKLLSKLKETITPVEISGSAGDCCFWHPRAMHSAGTNTSSKLRIIIPCDFQKDKPTQKQPPYAGISLRQARKTGKSLLLEDSGKHDELRLQWWVDTREFLESDISPRSDMWDDWNI